MPVRLHTHGRATAFSSDVLGRITREPRPTTDRADWVLVRDRIESAAELDGYAGVLVATPLDAASARAAEALGVAVVHGVRELDHLADGDVVAMTPRGYVRTLYRLASPHNAVFATDRCNSYCLMCSQPPKPVDDSARIAEHLRLVDLMDPATRELGITGGEPALLGRDLIRLIERCKDRLPDAAIHVLSNGRLFYYGSFASELAAVEHPDLMIGVPLYSDLEAEHDFVVQARGAFHQTMIGLQNLGRHGVPVEIRVVLHRHTVRRLPALAEFVYRNLTFASHVALMGLEMMGFAVANADDLWVDPFDYRHELRRATLFLARRGMNVSIYNHQLCVLPDEVWPYSRRSISDWKNDYLPACEGCRERERCGGFFTSSIRRRYSDHVHPIA